MASSPRHNAASDPSARRPSSAPHPKSIRRSHRMFFLLTVSAPFIIVAVLPGLDGPHYVPRPLHCG